MILAIDATNWIHQLWHTVKGNLIDLARVRLEALTVHCKASHVVACFDTKSFRHDLFDGYKAERSPKPTALIDALFAAPAALGKVCAVCREEGYEADDCLATLAKIGQEIQKQVVLATPDKDLRQSLVADKVTVLRKFKTVRGAVQDCDWLTAARLVEETGLEPSQWVDYQCLVGDDGDSIPGVPGWGPVTATAALQRLGTLDKCLANPFGVSCSARQRDALLAWRPKRDLVRKLVTLVTDVPGVMDCLR